MNREIKFRGKDILHKSWQYGSLAKDEPQKSYYIIDNEYGRGIDVDKETVGQYTGLHDKNGKEIYEGDIVKVFTNKKWRIGKIIYEHSGFTIDVTNNKELKYGRTSIIESLTEVIGNIHDNPELLEEGE